MYLPTRVELLVFANNLKQLVTGLLTVSSIKVMLERYRSLKGAYNINLFTFCTPEKHQVGMEHMLLLYTLYNTNI